VRRHFHQPARGLRLAGIQEQVDEDLAQFFGVGVDGETIGGEHTKLNVPRVGRPANQLECIGDDNREVSIHHCRRRRPADVQHSRDSLIDAIDFVQGVTKQRELVGPVAV